MTSFNPLPRLRWGILSTGKIARIFTREVAHSRTGRVVAVGSRTQASAETFAAEHGLAHAHGSYEALLANPEVDAVYVATPHSHHADLTVAAAKAGKHVLCEKPAALHLSEARRMIETARTHSVVFMEAFKYRCHPQIARTVELIRDGALGDVGLVQSAFGFHANYDPTGRLWAKALGGGAIMDVGCYPASLVRLIAGAASGRPFLEPVSLTGVGRLHPETGVDIYAAATLGFPNGVISQISCGIGLQQNKTACIYGTKGRLEIATPWRMDSDNGTQLVLHRHNATAPEIIQIEAMASPFAVEADCFGEAVQAGQREVLAMTPDDTLGNLATLERWCRAVGLNYE